jgi:putative transposase
MPRKRFTSEQIISKLREAEIRLGQGETLPDVCRALAVSEQTFYRWRKEFGGMKLSQAHRLKGLERGNDVLRRLVANLAQARTC